MITDTDRQKLNFAIGFLERAKYFNDPEHRSYEEIQLAYRTLEEVLNNMKEEYENS